MTPNEQLKRDVVCILIGVGIGYTILTILGVF